MKVDTIQNSFASGEFGPSLYGRTDIAQYENAVALCQNFFPRSYGPVISTPGTRYIATVSDSTLRTRLMSFVFNRTDSYIIEMGDKYMHFYTDRGAVTAPDATEDQSALTANIIAQYKCNDISASTVVVDSHGATYNGTMSTNTTTASATGKITRAFDFDGQYSIEIPDNDAFSFDDSAGAGPFSIVTWAFVTRAGVDQYIASKWNESGLAREWRFYINSSEKLVAQIWDESNDHRETIETNEKLPTGWHLLAITYDGRGGTSARHGMNLWVDSVLQTKVTRTSVGGAYVAMENSASDVHIGANYTSGAPVDWFQDKLDNVVFFDKELVLADFSEFYSSSAETKLYLTTPFSESEIYDVKYTQLNDTIWMTHPNHTPQKLVRVSANSWTIADMDFTGGPFLDANTTSSHLLSASAVSGTINVTASTATFTPSGSTVGHVGSFWRFGGLALTNATTGLEEYGVFQITDVIDSLTVTATVIKTLKAITATDNWAEGAWSGVSGFPAHTIFHDSRLWFARTDAEPQKVWGSRVFIYDDFALDTQADDDAINIALASNESNEIQWLASNRNLVAGTFGGVFILHTNDDNAVTPSNVTSEEQTGYGTEPIQPKSIGNYLFYIQRFGKKLREMFYLWDNDQYKATDKTILAPHILQDGVISMDVMNNPESVLTCVLTNGTIAIFTREVDQEVQAWSRIVTDGTFSSVAVIPSQSYNYDETYVIVERWIEGTRKKYIEVFENIEPPSRQDQCLYLHSALSYDAYESSSTSAVTLSLSATTGSVTATVSSAYFNGEMVTSSRRIRAIDENGATIGEGVLTATASTLSVTLSITTDFTGGLSYAVGRWGVSVGELFGLDHLEGETVGILADGLTHSKTETVSSNSVTMNTDGFVVSVGLLYDQILFTLPKEGVSQRGTSQGKWQRYNDIAFKLNKSSQDFQYGPDADNLDNVNTAFTPTVTSLYTGIIPSKGGGIAMRGGYSRGAQIYIKQTNPLPVEILNIIGTLTTEDK